MRTALLLLLPSLLATAGCGHAVRDAARDRAPRTAAPAAAAPAAFAHDEATLAGLQRQMAAGTLTSRALVQAYLARIAAIDDAGPRLNAVIETNPGALREADARDAERRAGRVRGPLHGIPLLLKDNIDATPMVNSAGSLALATHRPQRDAFLVRRLRDAGAVILGKTNLSEWANFRSTRSTSGWSARGGQTRNPYALDRTPCGSSAGTGSAVAANLAVAGVDTETDGSILCPAAMAALVGIKPTVGLVSRDGIIPISASQDTAGPMARSVADAATLLAAMAGVDGADPATAQARAHPAEDYAASLRGDALRGVRIGALRGNAGKQPAVDAAFERALDALRAAGAEVVDAAIPTAGQWDDAELQVLLYEFKDGLDRYLSRSGAPVASLEALIAWNQAHADRELPWFGQELFLQAQAKGPLTEAAYRDARDTARRLAREQGIDATLRAGRLDALVAPTTGTPWLVDPVNGDHFDFAGYGVAAVAGTPSITVPMGQAHGLPLDIAFLGPAWSEARLIGYAHAFEQRTRARTAPRLLETIKTDESP